MKRRLLAVLLGMALVLAGCGAPAPTAAPTAAGAGAPAASSEPIKIGGGFALTGDESALDLPAANGAKLAAKELNAAGGVLGRQIDLIVHDTQYKMDVTAQVAKQFVEQDKVVSVIGFTDTDSVLASGPTIQGAGLPFITAGATSPKIPTQVGDKMFLACFGDNVQAAAGAEFGADKYGKRAYLLWDKGVEYTTLLAGYFKARFTELGGTIVLEDQYDDKATDFSAQIAKVKALPAQPDFYYIAAMPYNVGPVVKQLRDAGITGPVIGGDGYDTPDLVSVAGKAAENVFFTTHALMDAQGGTAGIKKFIAAYNKEYGHDPENAFAALGYDTMYLLADAIKRAGATDAAAIQQAIKATKGYPGITGTITFGDSNIPQKGVTIIAIKDGKFTLGAEVVPQKVPAP
ncbi:MAG: ABC transporter substrate-binding protein [Kouleothrix sp.]|jgi:branched-chain amino acid transport system substrate-binding protein|nr:ABC transporter substrate-binding protein [Kouleothrix sp.]